MKSSSNFVNIIWPRIKPQIGGAYLIPVESVTDSKFAEYLDTQAGIDAWQVLGNVDGIRMVWYGEIEVDGKKIRIVLWKNHYKQAGDKKPDYQIEIDRREPGMVADPPKPEFTDDIPF